MMFEFFILVYATFFKVCKVKFVNVIVNVTTLETILFIFSNFDVHCTLDRRRISNICDIN